MELGIFVKTFQKPSLEGVLGAVKDCGLNCIQFNMACAGLPSMPDAIDSALCDRIREEATRREISIAAVSGTFNMIHPDRVQRASGLRRLGVLANAARRIGTSTITLCTGSRDRRNMWRPHPENASEDAWSDLLVSMEEAVRIAEEADVTLAFEPEVSNVVDTAKKGRRLLDEIQSPRLKVVMDGANLFHSGELSRMREVLTEAFDLLGNDLAIAHAKDLSRDGEAGHDAAGTGILDYDCYLALMADHGFDGPLILHSLTESQVADSVAFLRAKLEGLDR